MHLSSKADTLLRSASGAKVDGLEIFGCTDSAIRVNTSAVHAAEYMYLAPEAAPPIHVVLSNLYLHNLTSEDSGAAVHIMNSSVALQHVHCLGNTALQNGSAVSANHSTVWLQDSSLIGNGW